MAKSLPPKAIQLWMKSVTSAKKSLQTPTAPYGFVSGKLLKESLQIYCAKIAYGSM